nr:hypothetical protein [Tanacetum cinerariifolium]
MAELLRAPTEGYAKAIVVLPILAEQFELKHSLINMTTSDRFFGLEKDNPHDHIRWFNKITSTIKYKDVPNSTINVMLFPFSLAGAARRWIEKEPSRSILTWEDLVSKFINEFFPPSRTTNLRNEILNFQQQFDESFHEAWDRYKDLLHACPHHGFTELHQLDTFYNALNPADQDSLNSAAGGNLLERRTQDVLTIIENKSKIAKLTHAVNQQTSVVTTAMIAILKQFQATPPPAFVKAVEDIYVTYGGAHPYYQCLAAGGNTFPELRDNIQGYVSAVAVNYNQGNFSYRPPGVANQIRPLGFSQPNVKNNQNWFSQPQGYNRGNNLNQDQSYQAPTQQNQVVPLSELEKIKKMNEANMKAMQTQINNVKNELRNEMKNSIKASMSNQTNELKNMMASFFQMNIAFTSGSGHLPSNTIANPKGELKAITTRSGIVLDGPSVPTPPPFINPKEDERVEETLTDQISLSIPSRMHKQKQQEKNEVKIHKFWQMFKQLHINITLANSLILIPKYQKMLKALLSNKEKLLKLAITPLNENCSAVILKKLPKKLGDPGKFLIPCGFSELKCKALADLGASINLMPLSVWKKLGLPELISTRMTLELANRTICIPTGIARDVFVSVGKFTFPTDFVIVDYESDPKMILRDGDERLTLNMRHDTSSYSNQPQKESINMINIYDDSSEDFLEELCTTNHQSGNLTFSSCPKLTSPKVKDDVFDPEEDNVLIEKLLDLDSAKDNINLLIAKIKSLNDNPTLDRMLKPLSPSPIPVEDNDSFLEKSETSLSYSDISLPEFETFINHTEETNSGSTTTHADYSLPKYDSFLFEIEPDQGKLTSVVMKDNLAEPRVHVPNVLTTHPTLMLDTDFIPSDNSLLEYKIFYFDIEEKNNGSTTILADISLLDLESFNFNSEPDPGELTSIVNSEIHENDLSTTNVNLPPEEDYSALFAYVVWIFFSFLMYPVVPPNLLSFRNEDTILTPTSPIIISLLYCWMYLIEVFYIATNSKLNVSRFFEMHEAHTVVQARCLELETELSNLKDKIKKDDQDVMVKRFSNLEETRSEADRTLDFRALDFQITQFTENVSVLQEQNELFRVENAKVKQHYKELNNREVHLDYLKHLKESVATLREIVKEVK